MGAVDGKNFFLKRGSFQVNIFSKKEQFSGKYFSKKTGVFG